MNDITKLVSSQRGRLVQLNRRLARIETDVIREARAVNVALARRVKDNNDWLDDYAIDLEVSFHLDESDPKFDPESDNIVAQFRSILNGNLGKNHINFGIGDGKNHPCSFLPANHPLARERHCWLFHWLYDHQHVTWSRMARIGRIWSDIVVRHQSLVTLEQRVIGKSGLRR